jgi:hypothetical protein
MSLDIQDQIWPTENNQYFALASIRMTDDEIVRIKKDIGYCEWGKELHFKSMYTNLQGRAMLEKIFNHPLMDEKPCPATIALQTILYLCQYCEYFSGKKGIKTMV